VVRKGSGGSKSSEKFGACFLFNSLIYKRFQWFEKFGLFFAGKFLKFFLDLPFLAKKKPAG